MSGRMLLIATWICWMSYRNGYVGLLVLPLLFLLNFWCIIEMESVEIYLQAFVRCLSELSHLYSRENVTPTGSIIFITILDV